MGSATHPMRRCKGCNADGDKVSAAFTNFSLLWATGAIAGGDGEAEKTVFSGDFRERRIVSGRMRHFAERAGSLCRRIGGRQPQHDQYTPDSEAGQHEGEHVTMSWGTSKMTRCAVTHFLSMT